jgi:hypothetical protein
MSSLNWIGARQTGAGQTVPFHHIIMNRRWLEKSRPSRIRLAGGVTPVFCFVFPYLSASKIASWHLFLGLIC